MADEKLRKAVEVAERFADGEVDEVTLTRTAKQVERLDFSNRFPKATDEVRWRAASMAVDAVHESASEAAFCATAHLPSPVSDGTDADGRRMLCDVLRCVFGNPFQKPAFNKKWRSETVRALATGIYADYAFDRLPILADALEEAGCDDPAMLTHLRGTGPHCRGCWVLDLALGK